jgi:hypothetical protein
VRESFGESSARAVALTLVIIATLAGCAAPGGAGAGSATLDVVDSTLVETKSAVQLLRNEAASRVPDIVVNELVETADVSSACQPASIDPGELARAWRSTATLTMTNSQAARVDAVMTELVTSFTDQGWVAEPEDAATRLTRTESLATVLVEGTAKTTTDHATIAITVTGPCVLTEGPESDEVLNLERSL